jgi:hypothetical protein
MHGVINRIYGLGFLVLVLAGGLAGCEGDRSGEGRTDEPSDTMTTREVPPAPEPSVTDTQARDKDWERFVSGFIHGYFEHNPTAAVYAGKHEYDGALPTGARRASRPMCNG